MPWTKTSSSATGFTRDAGREAVELPLTRERPPDAIACADDLIAISVLGTARALRRLGVPGDLAVTGYDGIDAASLVAPALLTAVHPVCGRDRWHRLTADATDATDAAAEPVCELVVADSFGWRESG